MWNDAIYGRREREDILASTVAVGTMKNAHKSVRAFSAEILRFVLAKPFVDKRKAAKLFSGWSLPGVR